MTVEEKIIDIKLKVENAETVRDLKAQSAELVSIMEELGQKTDKTEQEMSQYNDAVELLVNTQNRLTTVMKEGKSQLSAQEGSYNALVNRMAALKKVHKSVSDEFTRSKLSEEIDNINNQLKEMDAKNGVYVRNVGNYENAIKAALKTPQQELKALRQELAQLTDGTEEYNRVFTRMAELTHQITEQQEQLKWSSADLGDILGNVAGVATSIAGGFSAFNALTGLVGGESEELEKAMLQAQRFIQLIQGLEQFEQLFDKVKGLWKGIKDFASTLTAASVSLNDFENESRAAAGAAEGAAGAMSMNATVTSRSADATVELADATKQLSSARKTLSVTEENFINTLQKRVGKDREKIAILEEEISKTKELIESERELVASGIADERNVQQLEERLQRLEEELEFRKKNIERRTEEIKAIENGTKTIKQETVALEDGTKATFTKSVATKEAAQATEKSAKATIHLTEEEAKNTVTQQENLKGLRAKLATTILTSRANKATAQELNAMTTAQLANTAATMAWSGALRVLKTALISTGIGAILVVLGSLVALLGKGLGKLWDWISGTNAAAKATTEFTTAMDRLNENMAAADKEWEHQEKLMKAQGKSAEELYMAEKEVIKAKLETTQALLKQQEAVAKDIGQRKLQKDKYEEFRETLEELREKEKELQQQMLDFSWDEYCRQIEEARKAEEKRAEEKKKAAEKIAEAYKKEKEDAEKLLKTLTDYYKTERQKLDEKYKEEKKLLEKYGKDTTLLTKKYEEDKTAIVLKEADARRKAREEFQRDIFSTLENPSTEYFEVMNKQLQKTVMSFANLNIAVGVGDIDINPLTDAVESIEMYKAVLESSPDAMKLFKEGIAAINTEYGLNIKTVDDFVLQMRIADKALRDNYKEWSQYDSDNAVKAIEDKIEAINKEMESETLKSQLAYELYASENNWYVDFTNNYISQMKLRWETEDCIFILRQQRLQEQLDVYKAAAENMTLTDEERLAALKKVKEIEGQIQLDAADYVIAQNQRKAEATENYVSAVQSSLDGISSILGNVASAWESSIQAQIDAGEISEEEGEREFEKMKGIQSAIALINTFSSAVSAYQSLAPIPFIGVPLAIAASAAAIASGLAQVAAINKVKIGDKSGGSSTRYAEVMPSVPSDYSPQMVQNITTLQETEALSNALTKNPLKAYVVEGEISSAQQKANKRNKEASF